MQQLLNHIKKFALLSNEAQQVLEEKFQQIMLSKNEYLLTEGKICVIYIFYNKERFADIIRLTEKKLPTVLSLFAAIAVQKNTRDMKAAQRWKQDPE